AANAASAGGNGPQRDPITLISLITTGASETSCFPAIVLLSTKVPRGRTALSASSKPDDEPVASMTISNRSGCQLSSSCVLTPTLSSNDSLSQCFPIALTFAPARCKTWAQRLPSLPSPSTSTSSCGWGWTCLKISVSVFIS